MNVDAIRMMANDADLKIDRAMLKFAELLVERCAVIAERVDDGEEIAERIRDYFEIPHYAPRNVT